MTKNKPVHEVRFGSIKASIWENNVGDGVRHNVTFARIYKDGEEWRSSDSFGREDLLLVAKVADQAHSWIHEQGARQPAPQRFGNAPASPSAPPRKNLPGAPRTENRS